MKPDLSHPIPEVVINKLQSRLEGLQWELEILQAKFVQLQGFMLDSGYAAEYEAWRVGRRFEGKEVV